MKTIEQKDLEIKPKIKRKRRKNTKKPGPKPKKKKPGPKPKPKPKESRKRPYRIILTVNNRQKNEIERFKTEAEAYQKMNEMLEENQKAVIFPKRFAHYGGIMREVNYNLYILRRLSPDETDKTTQLRNEYGEFVTYETTHSKWAVVDKCNWEFEESFWVYGYHPQYQRKDFLWIFTNFIEKTAHDKYLFKNIWLYHNKIIIESTEHLEIIFTKNKSDAIRFYNLLEKWCTQKKFKYVVFCGEIDRTLSQKWIPRLCEWTGFNVAKITRTSLRP